MRWSPRVPSRNVEDRRGARMAPMGIGGAILLLVLSLVFGRDFISDSWQVAYDAAGGEVGAVQQTPEEARNAELVSWVLDTAQATWSQLTPTALGAPWHDAKLVLFRGATPTACGVGQTAMGPFYCPIDEKVYIDLSFYDELQQRFGAPGDFAQAYVLAHELGHHVQHLVGTDAQVRAVQQRNPTQANHASVLLELQADCYAGVWGHFAEAAGVLEAGDLEEGLNAASAVGDDRLQREAGKPVSMDTFTHGSSAQREFWFRRGFQSGDPRACDTFAVGL